MANHTEHTEMSETTTPEADMTKSASDASNENTNDSQKPLESSAKPATCTANCPANCTGSTGKGSSSNNSQKLGRRGDPRMHRAVAARLEDPKLSLLDALKIGGFDLSEDGESSRTPDGGGASSDTVTLSQRKNQLSRRLRLVRQNKGDQPQHNEENDASPKAGNRDNPDEGKRMFKKDEPKESSLLAAQAAAVKSIRNRAASSKRKLPLAGKTIHTQVDQNTKQSKSQQQAGGVAGGDNPNAAGGDANIAPNLAMTGNLMLSNLNALLAGAGAGTATASGLTEGFLKHQQDLQRLQMLQQFYNGGTAAAVAAGATLPYNLGASPAAASSNISNTGGFLTNETQTMMMENALGNPGAAAVSQQAISQGFGVAGSNVSSGQSGSSNQKGSNDSPFNNNSNNRSAGKMEGNGSHEKSATSVSNNVAGSMNILRNFQLPQSQATGETGNLESKFKLALGLHLAESAGLLKRCMVHAGFESHETEEYSVCYLNFATRAVEAEGARLMRLRNAISGTAAGAYLTPTWRESSSGLDVTGGLPNSTSRAFGAASQNPTVTMGTDHSAHEDVTNNANSDINENQEKNDRSEEDHSHQHNINGKNACSGPSNNGDEENEYEEKEERDSLENYGASGEKNLPCCHHNEASHSHKSHKGCFSHRHMHRLMGKCGHKAIIHRPQNGNAHVDFVVDGKVECYENMKPIEGKETAVLWPSQYKCEELKCKTGKNSKNCHGAKCPMSSVDDSPDTCLDVCKGMVENMEPKQIDLTDLDMNGKEWSSEFFTFSGDDTLMGLIDLGNSV